MTAPSIVLGQTYTGNNSHCETGESRSYCLADLWRLPPLLLGDAVTFSWRYLNSGGPYACLTGNVDQFSWPDTKCNIASADYATGSPVPGSSGGRRTTFIAKAAASPAFLEFTASGNTSWTNHGMYSFTVEMIQNMVNVSIPAQPEIARTGTISISPRRVNNSPVVDRVFTLTARWDSGEWSTTAITDAAGNATFQLALPISAAGKAVTFKASAPETVTDQAAASADTVMRIPAEAAPPVVAPPVVVTPPVAAAKYPVLRVWSYKKASRLEVDVDPNLGLEWKVRLQKLNKGGAWIKASKVKTTKKTHRRFNPKRGTYRVVVYAKSGYETTASEPVYIRK